MRAVREKMEATDWEGLWATRKTMFAYGPEMSTDTVEAQMIKMFTFMKAVATAPAARPNSHLWPRSEGGRA